MLNADQQATIENSYWVVNTILKEQRLQANEDMRQAALLFMCECMQRFEPTKGVKWTTYAYKNVEMFIKRTLAKQHDRACHVMAFGDFDMKDQDMLFEIPQKSGIQPVCDYQSLLKLCTPTQAKVLELRREGYCLGKIGQKMGYSITQIRVILGEIKKNVRKK